MLHGYRSLPTLTTLGSRGIAGAALLRTGPITSKKSRFFFFFPKNRFCDVTGSVNRGRSDVIYISLGSPFRKLSFPILSLNRPPRNPENGHFRLKMTSIVKKLNSFKKNMSEILTTQ